ncbi:MAG: endonuclease/exonuclease/phosphatase family protein [Proteobacteria bacterium]|nr:endonuclease/exonuclease/phosphatase family protein [Pseudomonadota bacterium]
MWRVATLNIWNRNHWPERLPLLRDELFALDADVIGLQEVLAMPGYPTQADELAHGTAWHVFHAPAWNIGGGVTLGNAILSRYPLLDARVLPLPAPAELDQRSVAFARVDCPHGPLPVFVTHLTYQLHLASVRRAQVQALAAHVAALAPLDGPPPVLLWDFNAEPDADEIRFLRGLTTFDGASVYFADCWAATNPASAGYTYARDNRYALVAHEPSRRLDYCFVRGPDRHLRGEPISTRLALTEAIAGVWPSDHYAVVADIQAAIRSHGARPPDGNSVI